MTNRFQLLGTSQLTVEDVPSAEVIAALEAAYRSFQGGLATRSGAEVTKQQQQSNTHDIHGALTSHKS